MLGIIIFIWGVESADGKILYVPDNFSTIAEAISFAGVNDTIHLRSGRYYESIKLKNLRYPRILSIIGDNPKSTFVYGIDDTCPVKLANSDLHLENVTINYLPDPENRTEYYVSNNRYNIHLESSSLKAKNCHITSSDDFPCGGIIATHEFPDYVSLNTIDLYNTTISNCQSNMGGAILIKSHYMASNSEFNNCTFAYNNSSTFGGALCYTTSKGNSFNMFNNPHITINILNCTFAYNTASQGGAIYWSRPLLIRNSIFCSNTSNTEQKDNIFITNKQPVTSYGNNIDDSENRYFKGKNDLNNTDPLLLPLGYYDSDIPVFALSEQSPAIDRYIKDDNAEESFTLDPITDARGFPRPYGEKCDVGAVEYIPTDDIKSNIEEITISPNPFTKQCQIMAPAAELIEIYNLVGSLVQKLVATDEAVIWKPEANLSKGVYFINITDENKHRKIQRVVYIQ